jgi:hypothetical protein
VSCACRVGPGKFEGEPALAFLAYQNAEGADATTGVRDWFRRPFDFDTDGAVARAVEYGYCRPCVDESLLDDSYGLSLVEDEQGFVWLDRYPTAGEFDAALAAAEQAEQNWEE